MSGLGKFSFQTSNRVGTGWGRIDVSGITAGSYGPHKTIRTATLFKFAGGAISSARRIRMLKPL